MLKIHLLEKTARHQNCDCLTHAWADNKISWNCLKIKKYVLCWAVATFRPKWITAQIATGQQIVWKTASTQIIKRKLRILRTYVAV